MPKKTTASEYGLHIKIIAFSVITGLALAACQPRMTNYQVSPQPSPTPSPASTVTQGSLDKEVDKALTEMDASIKANNPNDLNGSDLQ